MKIFSGEEYIRDQVAKGVSDRTAMNMLEKYRHFIGKTEYEIRKMGLCFSEEWFK